MGDHGPTPCGTCAPGQLVRLTGRPEWAVPLSCGVKRSAAFGLLVVAASLDCMMCVRLRCTLVSVCVSIT